MSNNHDPQENPENKEPERGSGEKPEVSPLSLGDLVKNRQDALAEAKAQQSQDKETKTDASLLGSPQIEMGNFPKPSFDYPYWLQPQFVGRKSDFLHNKIERPLSELKPLIDNFLSSTPEKDDHNVSAGEKNALSNTRRALAGAGTANDVMNQALHLARLYQHLQYIEEAKKATNLSLGIDPENFHAKELFKELEHIHLVDSSHSTTIPRPLLLSKSNLQRRINNLSGGRVIVVGDLLIDEIVEGKPERISREAPVLILEHVDTEMVPGGAANTAHNIASLGGVCHAIGVCGRDQYKDKLAHLFDSLGIGHSLVQDDSRPTTVKTRIVSKAHSLRHQLLRLDRISHEPISDFISSLLVSKVEQVAADFKAIVLSDYRSGVISDSLIRACRHVSSKHNLLIIVDAQDHFERFQEATLITPNQPDVEQALGYKLTSDENLRRAGQELLLITGVKALLITRGAHGMVLFQEGEEMVELPVFNKSEVFDVTGAGDTVVATMALALTTGSNFIEAMALGNLAAGIVVRKQGTAVTTPAEMLQHLNHLQLPD